MELQESLVVLVAEDDENLIYFLRHDLEQQGYRALIVESGQEALRLSVSAKPAVIVLDVGLPDMSGVDLCRAIKQDRRTADIPVLFLTGHVDVDDRVAGLDAGAQDYLIKPFAMPEFQARIRAILRKQDELSRGKAEFSQRQEEFMSIINHELIAPLTVINMASQILAENHQISADRRAQLIQSIRGSANMLTSVIDDLLFLTNPTRRLRSSNIRQVTQALVEEMRPRVHEFGLHLVARIEPHLTFISLDEGQYRRALTHLIDNAIKFTPRGGTITVDIHIHEPVTAGSGNVSGLAPEELPAGLIPDASSERWLLITIKDTGIGIAPEHHRHVFEPFYQIDSTSTRNASGLGLGLAIVAAFVRSHHGQLAVRSGNGLGTAIHLALPLHQEELTEDADGAEGPDGA